MFLVVTRAPADPAARVAAAAATGLAVPDLVRRLTGPMPRVLLCSVDEGAVLRNAEALRGLGFGVITFRPEDVPGEADRIAARTLAFTSAALIATDPAGAEHAVSWGSVTLVQRAVRSTSEVEVTTTKSKELSLSRSLMSGGLVNRKTVEHISTVRTEAREAFVVVHRSDGKDVALSEKRMDFRFLGAEMQVVGFANLERTVAWLRRQLPGVPVDDRVARPGWLAGLGTWPGDPVDLSVEIVRRAAVASLSA